MFGINPKTLILNQLKARFEKLGLTRLLLTYNLKENTAQCQGKLKGRTVQVTDKNNSVTFTDVIDIPLDSKELSLLQKFLIDKITEKTKDCLFLYIEFDMEKEELSMFVRNKDCKLIPIKLENG